MKWNIKYLPEAEKDYRLLDHTQQLVIDKSLEKVSKNPLSAEEGGYGKPLGHKNGINLSGFYKIKLRAYGIRIVYQLIRTESEMIVIVIGMREDEEVYEIVSKRIREYSL